MLTFWSFELKNTNSEVDKILHDQAKNWALRMYFKFWQVRNLYVKPAADLALMKC